MARERLPNRRASEIITVQHDHQIYTAGFSRFDDGRVAEIFVDGEKVDAATDVAIRDAAIVTSIALQHGASLSSILSALTRGGNEAPIGALGAVLSAIGMEP